MVIVLQRVLCAAVEVEQRVVAQCAKGMLAYIAIQPSDSTPTVAKAAQRIVGYRIFSDAGGKMNLSVGDIGGDILLVPQFTLAANTTKGMRPSFSSSADPDTAHALFDALAASISNIHPQVFCGHFQADMQVQSVNDGPATFILTLA